MDLPSKPAALELLARDERAGIALPNHPLFSKALSEQLQDAKSRGILTANELYDEVRTKQPLYVLVTPQAYGIIRRLGREMLDILPNTGEHMAEVAGLTRHSRFHLESGHSPSIITSQVSPPNLVSSAILVFDTPEGFHYDVWEIK